MTGLNINIATSHNIWSFVREFPRGGLNWARFAQLVGARISNR
ncbi:hypothetical protein SV7mr_30000 [Stieleria bergensis]|uniref:Uncharacterized protein n=1 Tax=Stieleria bergensis TaxID=2528025 RepID=A0A517SWG8_9BACT|nr:hypothetical protein SV7mr_30000 [Planctomycetes bacterium SV_7m_r]